MTIFKPKLVVQSKSILRATIISNYILLTIMQPIHGPNWNMRSKGKTKPTKEYWTRFSYGQSCWVRPVQTSCNLLRLYSKILGRQTNLRGSITVRLTKLCLDSAALLMLNEQQQLFLFSQIQTSQTGCQPYSDLPPMVSFVCSGNFAVFQSVWSLRRNLLPQRVNMKGRRAHLLSCPSFILPR